ncbi:MAG: hypothetical protein HGB32_05205 [Geobacteraceae bacterium]|nr:hypothetical protein [Geobacteraceae bacterium]NTW79528.1 hypothetical protein [Geobacteraceae bacterium]
MNYEDIDFDNTVFVVDGILTAFIISIIARDRKINCIYEIKIGYESLEKIFDLLLTDSRISCFDRYLVPTRYYIIDKIKPFSTLKALYSFKSKLETLPLNKYKYYAGATTSSIMSMIYPEQRKIYIDHGTNNYYDRYFRTYNYKDMFMYKLFKALNLPNLFYSKNERGFTLCKMLNDSFMHIDYKEFTSKAIVKYIAKLIEATSEQRRHTLVLTTSSWHNKNGIDGDTSNFDDANIKMIERNTTTKEKLYIKYHPSLYYSPNLQISLIDKLNFLGYDAVNVNDLILDGLGLLIPAEIILRYCNITKVICEETALLWNVSHNPGIELIAEAELFEKCFGEKRSFKYVERLNTVVLNKVRTPTA